MPAAASRGDKVQDAAVVPIDCSVETETKGRFKLGHDPWRGCRIHGAQRCSDGEIGLGSRCGREEVDALVVVFFLGAQQVVLFLLAGSTKSRDDRTDNSTYRHTLIPQLFG